MEDNKIESVKQEIQNMSTDDIEKLMFEERKQMVEFAESQGQWQLFDDQQSIESMRESIETLEDSETKQEIRRRFETVEFLYNKYTSRIVGDVVSE